MEPDKSDKIAGSHEPSETGGVPKPFFGLSALLSRLRHGSSGYVLSRWLFLRLLGVAYFCAFVSFWIQAPGLIGENGILPVQSYLDGLKAFAGPSAYWMCPTITWLNSSNFFIGSLAGAGAVLSLLVVLGVGTAPALVVLYVLYLSLVSVGRTFLQFQWDAMLCECGFLSIFFAAPGLVASHWSSRKESSEPAPPTTVLWLLRLLLFRVMFFSGAVKLSSGDSTYRNLTALSYHWYTQPLPTPISWYMEQLPMWFQKVSELSMFAIELFVPVLIFSPRMARVVAGAIIIAFQTMIALTGNYCFFNLLTIALCILLFDDSLLVRIFPKSLGERITIGCDKSCKTLFPPAVVNIISALIIFLSVNNMSENLSGSALIPFGDLISGFCSPFYLVNSYGVFAVMTTERHEIIVEGSRDGKTWLPYEFTYKPGDLQRAPPWVEPHQPRLDWQMWFAALGSYENNSWFGNFIYRLLLGSPDVLALLAKNPFPDKPPQYIRAVVYDYHFTDIPTRRATGAWWRRQFVGIYFPVATLQGIVGAQPGTTIPAQDKQ